MSHNTITVALALLIPLFAVSTVAHADPNPCEGLTPAAIQAAIDQIDDAIAMAEDNLAEHPSSIYTYFGQYALANFVEARDELVDQQEWLAQLHLDSPFVSNTSASGGTYQVSMLQAASAVAHGVWYAGLSAIYTSSVEAKAAAELGGEANAMLAQIGSDSMGCFMRLFFPATW